MDRLATAAAGSGDADTNRQPPASSSTFNPARPTAASAAREASAAPARPTAQSSATSSTASSPFASREPSPSRSLRASIAAARNPSSGSGSRSRKNSQQDLSPSRPAAKTHASSSTPAPSTLHHPKSLTISTTPALLPLSQDPNLRPALPQKSASTTLLESQRDTPRWPISPRLRSPPPISNKPTPGLPRKGSDQDLPSINFQRPTPPVTFDPSQSDNETDDSHLQPGMRTPARGSTSTLETVQEVSPLGSPTPEGIDAALEKLAGERLAGDPASQPEVAEISINKSMKARAVFVQNESGSEAGSIKAERRPAMTSAPSGLGLRQPSSSTLAKTSPSTGNKTPKPSEGTVKTMTVETETVTSIPQLSVAPAVMQGSNGSLRTKQSSETIRPRKEKRKPSRKQQMVQPGAGETLDPQSTSAAYGARVLPLLHHQSIRSSSARAEVICTSPIRSMSGQGPLVDNDAMISPRRWSSAPSTRSRTLGLTMYQMNNLLTRPSLSSASSKADNFEAKIASAVDEADTSDSDETFVYDSNPPDARDRPHNRFHSRTPSATSMASQMDRNGMRSIHGVMDVGHSHAMAAAPGSTVMAKKKKFSNTYNVGISENVGLLIDEEGGSARGSASGSGRGVTVARHPHHIGLWGRPGNGHTYLFDNDASPFVGPQRPRLSNGGGGGSARNSPAPPSPRFGSMSSARVAGSGKRGPHLTPAVGYDLDDATTGADDERTPLIQSMRSPRTRRGGNRYHHSLMTDHQQRAAVAAYRQHQRRHQPSLLNRMASCLVLTVMLLLVVSGAIGFMFATSQPLTGLELIKISNVIASEQELMFDMMVKAQNPNVVLVVVDSSDLEIFAKSPYSGPEPASRQKPSQPGPIAARRAGRRRVNTAANNQPLSPVDARAGPPDDPDDDPPPDDMGPLWRLGTVRELDQPLQFEGSFFNKGASTTTGGLRLEKPGNSTEPGGTERWGRVIEDEFELVVKGVLKYSLPLSQRVRTIAISGKTRVKPNSASDPGAVAPGEPAASIII